MERLKHMSLRRAFFLLAFCGLLAAAVLAVLLWAGCGKLSAQYPLGGVTIGSDGTITQPPAPTPEQWRMLELLEIIALLGAILFPVAGLAAAGTLFYRWKLKGPIVLLLEGTRRIQAHDLDFTIPAVSSDELGQICAAFEGMRLELLKTNQELWRQAEERRRLNAAFAHDLRNPITVVKGSIKLLRQNPTDGQTLDRLERYALRIEQYVEAMSSIQRLEQLPLKIGEVSWAILRSELEETARLLAPALEPVLWGPEAGAVRVDHGILLTVAENLIGNAARYARKKLELTLALEGELFTLTVADDGPGFPPELLQEGPKPFGRLEENGAHFGMGLYSSSLLCQKHGGTLRLENRAEGGAAAAASLQINCKP